MKLTTEDGICTLTPTTDEERAGLRALMRLKIGDKLEYLGRGPDAGEGFFTVRVKAGKGVLLISGDEEDDRFAVNNLRNVCYFSSGLFYMGRTGDSVKLTGGQCKICGAQVVKDTDVEWKVCHGCYEKCDHVLGEPDIVHGRRGLDIKRYCQKCGRVPQDIVSRIGDLEKPAPTP